MTKRALLLILIMVFPTICLASTYLAFSDIISGPASGLNDGLGSGAIVTVWGNSLGTPDITSGAPASGYHVYFKDSTTTQREAAYVYYWCNADGGTSGGGPSDLYSYHEMQEVSFSIPDSATGAGKIYIVTPDGTSNELDFTVRSGDILHVKDTGTDGASCGAWGTPCASIDYAVDTRASEGTTIYVGTHTETNMQFYTNVGTETGPVSIIAYPGEDVTLTNSSTGDAVSVFNNGESSSDYINLSKCSAITDGGIRVVKGARIIGNAVTDKECANAVNQGGAICPFAFLIGGEKIFGNYIHDYGCGSTGNLQHTTYWTARWVTGLVVAPEWGWNFFKDNLARQAIHFYEEGTACNGYSGTVKIHDNVMVNQVGDAIDITGFNCSDGELTGTFEIYNNMLIECGQANDSGNVISPIWINGELNTATVYIYNNLIYGYGETVDANGWGDRAITVPGGSFGLDTYYFGGTWTFKNNIIVDTHDRDYYRTDYITVPSESGNNLWYSGGDSTPATAPAWDTDPLTDNPLFTNTSTGDFTLGESSPCIGAGEDLSAVFTRDIIGKLRSSWDIGAFEYATLIPYSPTVSNAIISNGSIQ